MMKQRTVTYTDNADKLLGQLVYDDENSAPQPGVVLFPAFEGIAEFSVNYAKDLIKGVN